MYKKVTISKSSIRINNSVEGESIEQKLRRITTNKEPIGNSNVPIIYTERKEGVLPAYDIRTDRFEIAVEAMDIVAKSHAAKREERHNPKVIDMKTDSGAESTQDSK